VVLPKAKDKILVIQGATTLPGTWTFDQLAAACAAAQNLFTNAPLLPVVIVPLKSPTDILWKIERR
jgi:hypothetical protein